jgi:hypothetical protein
LAATSFASSSESPFELPGTNGTPAASMARRALVFEPMIFIDLALGPMNFTPAFSQASAKAAFSERKP